METSSSRAVVKPCSAGGFVLVGHLRALSRRPPVRRYPVMPVEEQVIADLVLIPASTARRRIMRQASDCIENQARNSITHAECLPMEYETADAAEAACPCARLSRWFARYIE